LATVPLRFTRLFIAVGAAVDAEKRSVGVKSLSGDFNKLLDCQTKIEDMATHTTIRFAACTG